MSETKKLLDSLVPLAEKIVMMSDILSSLSKTIESKENQDKVKKLVLEVSKIEESADEIFEGTATRIMNVEFLNINPDYLLEIAKQLDKVSDLLERAALVFQYLVAFEDSEISELISAATTQVVQIANEFVSCLKVIGENRSEVDRICEKVSEREKVVDGIRERFNSYAIQKTQISESRIWLKDVFGYLDEIADLARDLTITFRVVSLKLEKQRTLSIKEAS